MPKHIEFMQDQATGGADNRVEWLESCYKTADAMRRRQEPEWYTNALFLYGNQYQSAQDDMRRFTNMPVHVPSSKIKLVSNFIYPYARQAASNLRKSLAQQIAIAATSDQLDVDAATLSTDFLLSRHHEDQEADLRFHETLWCMVAGRVLRKTVWDPEADSMGIAGKMQAAGDISTVTLNPWRFHTCPWVDCTEEQPWIIESDVRGIDEVNDLFPGHDVKEEEVAQVTMYRDRLLASVTDGGVGSAEKREKACVLKRMYCRPTKAYPRGRLWVWASGKLLQEVDLPEGEMPFVILDWFPVPGRTYPLPFITPLRDLQKERNITLSQLAELKNRQLRGDIVYRGTGEATTVIDKVTGQKTIKLPPSVLEWKFIDYRLETGEAEVLLARLDQDGMQIAGLHEPSLGQSPGRAVTATQVAMLKESDMSGLSLFQEGFDSAHSKISRHKLLVARNHYAVPRMLRVVGEKDAVQVKAFMGSDLRNTEDVRPRPTPVVTETMKAQMKTEAATNGLYGPYAGPKDKYSKLVALSNSGIPGIEEEVDKLLGGKTLDELAQIVAQLDELEAALALAGAQAQLDQLTLQQAAMEAQAQGMMGGAEGQMGSDGMPMEQGMPGAEMMAGGVA